MVRQWSSGIIMDEFLITPQQKSSCLGELLVKKNLVTEEQLSKSLKIQQKCKSLLSKVLLGEGYIHNYPLYLAIAEQHNLPFVDLIQERADDALLLTEERSDYNRLQLVPWKKQGSIIVLATPNPSEALHDWANSRYQGAYSVVITSPFDILWTLQRRFATEDDEDSREKLCRSFPEKSAKTLLSKTQIISLLFLVMLFVFYVLHDPKHMAYMAFLSVNIFYAVTISFKTLLFLIGFLRRNATLEHTHESLLDESELPVYTILIPLFKEKDTLPKLADSIRNLDYPKSKLDVKFVVEADDDMTINALKALKCESFFEIIRVPYSLPRTKPKACNYALRFAKGSYVTIYDAEDTPHPKQLKKVIAKFKCLPKDVVCIQAKLNYFNRKENFITRMFAIEYASWFDFMLLGLEALNIPIPLGGTSNHFVLSKLRELEGWDPYNVTEDADLGVRLASYGYRVSVIDSLTLEEAPILVQAWLSQRSRWIKGYMQTYIVHMRHPIMLYHSLGPTGFMGFQLFIGAPCVLFLITPFIWLFWGIELLGGWEIPSYFIGYLHVVGMFNLVAGLIIPVIFSLTVIVRSKWWDMLHYSFAFPLYWVLHSIASFKALWQLIFRPHYWEKTSHGLTQMAWKRSEE